MAKGNTTHHQTTDRVAESLHGAVDTAAARAATTEERLRQEAAHASERLRHGSEYARSRTEELAGNVTGYVRENPLMALGLAFAAGTLFSALTRRR
ncbi:hypothetical protein K8B33_00700 [Alcanivorax sp. JB21]|uniref:DUF883 family protein n=1 Tax=Alcanivorax limicola TaxID=2874102 RepID=UPI001CBDBBF4|nr:hypothetical protein [Alcanivorax limicola]MBZ2187603.1 hypothetical protein [Alcanivorax limicola]